MKAPTPVIPAMYQDHRQAWRGLALAAGAALLLSACVVAPAPYYRGGGVAYGPAPGAYGEVVMTAPPAPYQEVVPVSPGLGYVWIGGYWNWVGGRHVWAGGHWEPGRPGYAWVPHNWGRTGNGWRLNPGHWQRH